jgi:Tol biopolymer transport system component
LTDKYSSRPSFSPDGKLIACFYKDKQEPSVSRMALISSEGGQPVRMFDTQSTVRQGLGVRWAPDGGALTYVDCPEGVCNFWSQPVDGGPPKQLTNFESDQIWSFDLMPDGKRLVCSRGNPKGDLVMISNFR